MLKWLETPLATLPAGISLLLSKPSCLGHLSKTHSTSLVRTYSPRSFPLLSISSAGWLLSLARHPSIDPFAKTKRLKADLESPNDFPHGAVSVFAGSKFLALLFTVLCKSILPSFFCSTVFNYLQLLWWKRHHPTSPPPPASSWATGSREDPRDLWQKGCFFNISIDQLITHCLFWALCLVSLNSSFYLFWEIHHLQGVINWALLSRTFPCKLTNLFPPSCFESAHAEMAQPAFPCPIWLTRLWAGDAGAGRVSAQFPYPPSFTAFMVTFSSLN